MDCAALRTARGPPRRRPVARSRAAQNSNSSSVAHALKRAGIARRLVCTTLAPQLVGLAADVRCCIPVAVQLAERVVVVVDGRSMRCARLTLRLARQRRGLPARPSPPSARDLERGPQPLREFTAGRTNVPTSLRQRRLAIMLAGTPCSPTTWPLRGCVRSRVDERCRARDDSDLRTLLARPPPARGHRRRSAARGEPVEARGPWPFSTTDCVATAPIPGLTTAERPTETMRRKAAPSRRTCIGARRSRRAGGRRILRHDTLSGSHRARSTGAATRPFVRPTDGPRAPRFAAACSSRAPPRRAWHRSARDGSLAKGERQRRLPRPRGSRAAAPRRPGAARLRANLVEVSDADLHADPYPVLSFPQTHPDSLA